MKKILLIEDDLIMRENISELIELAGYEVQVAENGLKGVALCKTFEPDLIVCDVMMPELDGYGVLYILSQNADTATIPFIFLTAKTETDDLRKGMELGADDYLFKPFDSTELIKAIESRLRKSELLKNKYETNSEGIHDFLQQAKEVVTLEDIKEKSHVFQYGAREYIYKEGEHVHFVYYIEKGSVKAYRHSDEGKDYITSVYTEGQFFGFQPIFEERNYDEITETLEPTILTKISKKDFLTLVYENRDVARNFIQMISKTLSSKEDDLMLMAYSSVRKRVSKKIQELLNGSDEITILRTDLAKLTGTTKESLTRVLTEFKNSEIIEANGKTIKVVDLEKLKQMDLIW